MFYISFRSYDGRILVVSSTDGYCSLISFAEGELGTPYREKIEENITKFVESSSLDPKETRPISSTSTDSASVEIESDIPAEKPQTTVKRPGERLVMYKFSDVKAYIKTHERAGTHRVEPC